MVAQHRAEVIESLENNSGDFHAFNWSANQDTFSYENSDDDELFWAFGTVHLTDAVVWVEVTRIGETNTGVVTHVAISANHRDLYDFDHEYGERLGILDGDAHAGNLQAAHRVLTDGGMIYRIRVELFHNNVGRLAGEYTFD